MDHVVAAIVAVLAHPPEPGDVGYFHVSSGDRNPLTFNVLYSSVRTYFDRHPFTAGDRGAARLPEWRFPGARSVERLLSTSERAWKVADYAIGHAPRSDRARDLARKLHQQGRRLEFLRRYLNLYMEYATAELRFSDKQTMALYESLSEEDRATFAFDTAVIDWPHYFIEVHCPSVTAPVRRLDELRALRKRPRGQRLRQVGGDAPGIAAFFDMDGTLLSSNVIETYLWVRLRELDGTERLAELSRIASKVPSLVQAERRSRSDFLRGDLPGVRRRPARRPQRGRRRLPDRPRPVPALARRRAPDPRAPQRRAPDRADHRGDPAAHPPAAPAVRPHRGRRPRGRLARASAPASWRRHRSSGSPGPPGCGRTPRSTTST